MTTVPLSVLLRGRDESLMVTRTRRPALRRALSQVRAYDWTPARRALLVSLLAVAGVLSRHGLVVAGLAAFVIAAATVSLTLAWAAGGAGLLFLEVRRR